MFIHGNIQLSAYRNRTQKLRLLHVPHYVPVNGVIPITSPCSHSNPAEPHQLTSQSDSRTFHHHLLLQLSTPDRNKYFQLFFNKQGKRKETHSLLSQFLIFFRCPYSQKQKERRKLANWGSSEKKSKEDAIKINKKNARKPSPHQGALCRQGR